MPPQSHPAEPTASLQSISAEEVAEFRARSRFREALGFNARSALKHFDFDVVFHRSINDMGVFLLGLFALYLHYTKGLSHRQLRDFGGKASLVSAGRATAILWRLQHLKLIHPVDDYRSGAVRLYRPEPLMIEAYRSRMALECQALSMVEPVGLRMGDLRALDLFRRLTVEQGRMVLAAAAQPNAFVAPIIDLSMKTAGMPLIYHLIDAAFAAGAGRPAGTIEVSVAAAARRFGVSRAHIARLITRMEGLGYIERSPAPNTLILTEAFAEAYETYYAFGHIALARACHGALDSTD